VEVVEEKHDLSEPELSVQRGGDRATAWQSRGDVAADVLFVTAGSDLRNGFFRSAILLSEMPDKDRPGVNREVRPSDGLRGYPGERVESR